jgi:hypothetical protein
MLSKDIIAILDDEELIKKKIITKMENIIILSYI